MKIAQLCGPEAPAYVHKGHPLSTDQSPVAPAPADPCQPTSTVSKYLTYKDDVQSPNEASSSLGNSASTASTGMDASALPQPSSETVPMTNGGPSHQRGTTNSTNISAELLKSDLTPRLPYPAPPDIIYPEECIENPSVCDMNLQPVLDNISAHSLYRPAFLPARIDPRLDKNSIWVGIDRYTSEAIYFITPSCLCCKHPAYAKQCDRAWPNCARCGTRGIKCLTGTTWSTLRPSTRGKNAGGVISPAAANSRIVRRLRQQGHRANETAISTSAPQSSTSPTRPAASLDKIFRTSNTAEEPAKRPLSSLTDSPTTTQSVAKRSRLGLSNQIAPSRPAKPRGKAAKIDDELYFARIKANSGQTPLDDTCGVCQVWADTRNGLQSALDYLREPRQSLGASVDISPGGVARGVILEGAVDPKGVYWGMREHAGTIITSVGYPRARKANSETLDDIPSINSEPPTLHSSSLSDSDFEEAHEIVGLIEAQKARTPVALAVAQDFNAVPFRVDKPFKVLGWFWVVDAWLEPIHDYLTSTSDQKPPENPSGQDPEQVTWKFRFEWCTGGSQPSPWWSSSTQRLTQFDALDASGTPNWDFAAPDEVNTVKFLPPSLHREAMYNCDGRYTYACEKCRAISNRIYLDADICLNERCTSFFLRDGLELQKCARDLKTPGSPRPLSRIQPDQLSLSLCPTEPGQHTIESRRDYLGSEYWKGWVCGTCRLAQERNQWAGWKCTGCQRSIEMSQRTYSHRVLRPTRPVCTGPRQEDGNASWPQPVPRSWSSFPDDTKAIRYEAGAVLGYGTEVHHLLSSEKLAEQTGGLFARMQYPEALDLERHVAVGQKELNSRPAEVALSPFYTYLAGTSAVQMPAFPTKEAVPWQDVSKILLETMDLINFQAARMFPGQQEFGNLTIAAFPPQLPASSYPNITVPGSSYIMFLIIGSDCSIRLKATGPRNKQSELVAQHGDLVGLYACAEGVNVSFKMDGFGFVCISQRYNAGSKRGHITRPIVDADDKPISRNKQRQKLPKSSLPEGSQETSQSQASLNSSGVSLKGWYIGGVPLDTSPSVSVQPDYPWMQALPPNDEDNVAEVDRPALISMDIGPPAVDDNVAQNANYPQSSRRYGSRQNFPIESGVENPAITTQFNPSQFDMLAQVDAFKLTTKLSEEMATKNVRKKSSRSTVKAVEGIASETSLEGRISKMPLRMGRHSLKERELEGEKNAASKDKPGQGSNQSVGGGGSAGRGPGLPSRGREGRGRGGK